MIISLTRNKKMKLGVVKMISVKKVVVAVMINVNIFFYYYIINFYKLYIFSK